MSGPPDTRVAPARILIVDDGEDNRELLKVILDWEGYATQTAASGEQALASVAEAPPDLLLLDLILPGLSGCEVTVQMKANPDTERIPIIVISGRGDEATRRLALGAGAVDFITKPIDRADLCRRVRSTLGLPAKC
jgi:CheY-like chemotaxis protein